MKFSFENNRLIGHLQFGDLPASPDVTKGYKPYELMLTSIVTCSASLLRNLLQKKRMLFSDMSFIAEGTRNPDVANRIESISITANVSFNQVLDDKQLEKLEQLVINNCGMIQTIISSVDITYKIHPKYLEN